jgi:hypothetical protein
LRAAGTAPYKRPNKGGSLIMNSYIVDDRIELKARALGVSAKELVELAVQSLEIPGDAEAAELRRLVDQVNRNVPETLRILDSCHRKIGEILPSPLSAAEAGARSV